MTFWGRGEDDVERPKPWGLIIAGSIAAAIILVVFLTAGLFTVKAGEVGVRFDPFGGGVQPTEYTEGLHVKAPWVTIDHYNVKTQDYTMSSVEEEGERVGDDAMRTVTSEGLYVTLEVTVLYKAGSARADSIRKNIGKDGEYQEIVVRPTIRSIIRDIISRYEAADVYGAKRSRVENEIYLSLSEALQPRGILAEKVLLRSVTLPAQLTRAIEEKKQAEQEAMRMTYVIEKEALEKERKVIEAGGISEANKIIANSLTTSYLQWYWIDNLKHHDSVIYVPSEGGLPIFKNVDTYK